MEIRFSQSDTRKVFLACEKKCSSNQNHAFVLQGMNIRQFSRHFCLLHPQRTPQPSSLNASRVESGCLKKGRFFVAEKCFLILSVLNVFNYKVYHQGPSCKHPPIISESASYTKIEILLTCSQLVAKAVSSLWSRRSGLNCRF